MSRPACFQDLEVTDRANPLVASRFGIFDLHWILTCNLMDDNYLFAFSCLIGQSAAKHTPRGCPSGSTPQDMGFDSSQSEYLAVSGGS